MANAFSNSWEVTKTVFSVMKKDKEMFLFPILAGIFSIIFILAMIVPLLFTSVLNKAFGSVFSGLAFYIAIFILYFGLAIIATFFNVCVVFTAKTRFEGKDASFTDSLKFAFSRLHLIVLWALTSAVVGLILRILDDIAERMGGIGELIMKGVNSLLGMGWAIVTVFVIPSMVYNNVGPFAAIKNSLKALQKTWGESLIRVIGVGILQFVFLIIGIVIGVILALIVAPFGFVPLMIVIMVVIMYITLVILFFSVLNTVFNAALYHYAETGKVPKGFDKEMMDGAFKRK